MKIVVLDGYLVGVGKIDWTPLSKLGEYVYYDMTTGEDDVAEVVGNADVVLSNRCPLTAETIKKCPNLKLIHSFGTGYNQIDLKAAEEAGIVITNTPAYGRGAVAQMAMALLMAAVRNVAAFDAYLKTEGWQKQTDPAICAIPQMELTGKTMGIIGLGDIGYAVARIAMAMDMKVLAYQRTPDKSKECEQLRFTTLDDLVKNSDVISIHTPLTPETEGLINAECIAKMKDGVILINTGRGRVIDENAVKEALDTGKIAVYGTDVFYTDPCGKDHPLATHPHCIATPHVAWMPLETRQRIVDIAAGNIEAFQKGECINTVHS